MDTNGTAGDSDGDKNPLFDSFYPGFLNKDALDFGVAYSEMYSVRFDINRDGFFERELDYNGNSARFVNTSDRTTVPGFSAQAQFGGNTVEFSIDHVSTFMNPYDFEVNMLAGSVIDPLGEDTLVVNVTEVPMTFNDPPVVIFTVNSTVQALENVIANPDGTYDPYGDPIKLIWNWGDGTPVLTTSSLEPVTHKYNRVGDYTVTLSGVISNRKNITATYDQIVHVNNDGEVIHFKNGWNQISTPIETNQPAGVVFAGVCGYVQMWEWNATLQQYETSAGETLKAGKGYFIFTTCDMDFEITGTGESKTWEDMQKSHAAGWNMVGPGIDTIALPSSVWAYNYNSSTNSYEATHMLEPGKGYWIMKVYI